MNNKEKLTAKIVFMPTCSYCGYKLENQTIDFAEEQLEDSYPITNAIFPRSYEFTPKTCPSCRAIFNSIIIPTELPFETESLSEYNMMNFNKEGL